MKIAIVGPIESAMTADSVGGTETWTYHFAEELVRRGHEVTLFGAEGTKFSGKFVAIYVYLLSLIIPQYLLRVRLVLP